MNDRALEQPSKAGWRRGVTLRDVAREAGVSVTTVSRILNGREMGVPIRDDTRTRILAVAAELGYTPNMLARGLRGQRSSLLGVIARDISDPFHLQILRGINEAARARDYRLFLGHVDYRPEVVIAYGSMFERSHADGIIVIGDLEGGDAALDILSQQHRYIVGVTDRTQRRQVPGVYGDSTAGTLLGLDHLWAQGHRAIVCVSDSRTYDGRQRIQVYERFMRERGQEAHIEVRVTDQEPAESYELGKKMFLDWKSRPASAVFAASDTTAFGLMKAAFEADISIPDELSIVGYDDIDLAAYAIPPLTTVSQSGVEMGLQATELLFQMISAEADRDDVADIVMTPELVVRDSTAPA